MIMSREVGPIMSVQGQNPGHFPNLEDFIFDTEPIKILLCSVAKVEPLVLKEKIGSRIDFLV